MCVVVELYCDMCVCVCVCVCVWVGGCVRACVGGWVRACVRACVCRSCVVMYVCGGGAVL